jgi:RimJ/RimL family protein N-acetyltransferase
MIVTGYQDWVCRFLIDNNSNAELPEACQTFAIVDKGVIQGAIAIHHSNGVNCWGDIALLPGVWPRKLVRAVLYYVFTQLQHRRLTMLIAASNLKSISLVEKLGAYREATLQDGCSDGDAYIYCLRPDKCPKWSNVNEQTKRKQTSGT